VASRAVVVPAGRDLGLDYWIFGLTLSDENARDKARRAADRGGWSVTAAARPRLARVGVLRAGEAMSLPPRLQDLSLCVPKLAFI